MNYNRLFNPAARIRTNAPRAGLADESNVDYVYSEKVILAVNLALATKRPLFVSGPSGCGKTSLAKDVADVLDWEYAPSILHSRMQHRDLFYSIDYVRRFQDAQPGSGGVKAMREYIEPGVLWRAFDPNSANDRNVTPTAEPSDEAKATGPTQSGRGVVVLLDEIDKAEPDVPNNLLQPLGSYRFRVDELDTNVCAQRRILLVITTNNERRMPDAFLRRCVDLPLEPPDATTLLEIGEHHFGAEPAAQVLVGSPPQKMLKAVADLVQKAGGQASTAEYLDTVRAVLDLNVAYDSPDWKDLPNYTVRKSGRQGGV